MLNSRGPAARGNVRPVGLAQPADRRHRAWIPRPAIRFQPTLFYHGFAASALQGTPQGLAVYVNGMRFNQPFGDTVDWDLIPDIAIDRINLVGSNPVFGLNALGGAVNVQLKNGFTYQGFEGDLSGGSFGQVQGEFQYGKQIGNVCDLCRRHRAAPGRLARSAIDRICRTSTAISAGAASAPKLHLNVTAAHSILNGPGTSPVELLAVESGGPVHRAQSDHQPVRRGQPDPAASTSPTPRRCRRSRITATSCSGSPTATRRTTRPATTAPGCCASMRRSAPRSAAASSRTSSTAARIRSSTTRPPTPTPMAPRCRSPTPTSCSACRTSSSRASASTARRPCSAAASFIGGLTPLDRVFVGPGIVIDEPRHQLAGARRRSPTPTTASTSPTR